MGVEVGIHPPPSGDGGTKKNHHCGVRSWPPPLLDLWRWIAKKEKKKMLPLLGVEAGSTVLCESGASTLTKEGVCLNFFLFFIFVILFF
jgi:hypothetical protein